MVISKLSPTGEFVQQKQIDESKEVVHKPIIGDTLLVMEEAILIVVISNKKLAVNISQQLPDE